MKLISSFIKAEDDAKQISNVNEGIVKDVKRMFAGKTAKDRARQEIEKAFNASVIDKDNKKSAKHWKRYDKFDELANGGVKMRKVAALSDDDLAKYYADIIKGVAGWDPEYGPLRTALKNELNKRKKLKEDTDGEHAWGPLDEGVADKIKSFAKGILSPKNEGKAETILQKYKNLKEAITYTDINDWKQAVKNSYPQQAKRISFLSKMQGNKMTVSAEIKGEDRCYGVWDQEDDKGVVLSEAVLKLPAGITLKDMKDDYNTFRIMRDGKVLGMIWQDDVGASKEWSAEVSKSGNSWDSIDSKRDALDLILDELGLSESHNGSLSWSKTKKTGTHDATGEPTFEWQELDSSGKATGNREWRNAAGKCMDRKKLKEAGLKGSVNKLMDKAAIKKAELDQELGDEDTKANTKMKFGIEIDGKLWKKDGKAVDFPSKVAATKAALSGSLAFKKTTVVPL